jgi:hypothetical protein
VAPGRITARIIATLALIRDQTQVLILVPTPARILGQTLVPIPALTRAQILDRTQDQGVRAKSTFLHQKGRSLSGLFAMH